MQRNLFALIVGTAVIGAAALAACSSGGGNSNTVPSAASQPAGGGAATLSNGTLTLTINRAQSKQVVPPKPHANAKQRLLKGTRRPAYINPVDAEGLQVAVTVGSTTKTIYADIRSTPMSPLCTLTNSGASEVCTITVPTVGTNETIVATEVDQAPTSSANGYGTGFPSTSNVLAAGTTTATIAGSVAISLGLSPVLDYFTDCADGGAPNYSNTNAETDSSTNRILVTAGLAQTATFYLCVYDADGNSDGSVPTPLPSPLQFADLNGAPEPITVTSTTQHVLFQTYIPYESATPTPAFALTASATNESQYGYNYYLCFGMQLDGNLTTTGTVTVSNNHSAPNPFPSAIPSPGAGLSAFPQTYTVVPVSVSPLTATVSHTGTTATVTGSDYGGVNGMDATADPTNSYYDHDECLDGSATELASVVATAPISTTNWTQSFTITGMSAGTCTFYLFDENAGVESQAVTVTVN